MKYYNNRFTLLTIGLIALVLFVTSLAWTGKGGGTATAANQVFDTSYAPSRKAIPVSVVAAMKPIRNW